MANNNKGQSSSSGRGGSGKSEDGGDVLGIATRAAGRAKDAVKEQLESQVEKSANDLDMLAKTLRLASEQLEGNIAAPMIGRLASGVDRVAKYVEDADARDLLRRAESLGREQPLVFIGAAAALGFIGGRFLKSSGSGQTSTGRAESDERRSGSRVPSAAISRGADARARRANGTTNGAERRT